MNSVMKKIGLVVLALLLCGVGDAYAKKAKAQQQVLVEEHVLLYPSVDQHGDSLVLSGKVCVPKDKKPKGIVFIPHYTIASNSEAPSIKMTGESRAFKDEYVLLMPDFIGFGATVDRIHPYLHGELTARNGVDMILGARPLLDSLNLGISLDSIYIVGYSQGGASALWTLKLIEEQYADRIFVRGCFAGDGPYDVAVTFDEAVRTKRINMPVLIPMLMVGTDVSYDLGLNYNDFFTPATMKVYEKYIMPKDCGIVKLFMNTLNHNIKHWLKPGVLDGTQPYAKKMYEGLERSSLITATHCPSWIPKSPLYVFHSVKDEVVTILCAEHLQRCLGEQPNITYDFGKYGNHMNASKTFFPIVRRILNEQNP